VNGVFALGCLLFVTDVSGQPIGPIFKGQAVTECFESLALEYGADRLSRNITN